VLVLILSRGAGRATRARTGRRQSARTWAFAGIGCLVAAAPALAQNWRLSASASASETYTSNVDFTGSARQGAPAEGDFVTSLSAGVSVSGGSRLTLNGSIGATAVVYAKNPQNSNIALTPNVNVRGTFEAIDNFAYVDVQVNANPQFISPFGPQPGDLANATNNRIVSQTYAVSPYIRGHIPGSSVSYQLRDDNIWTFSSEFGGSSTSARVPATYSNGFTGSMSSPASPWGWTLEYSLYYYESGFNNVTATGEGVPATTTQAIRLILPYQIDPQLQVAPRIGYESNGIGVPGPRDIINSQGTIYGIGGQWNPTDRTQVGGFWEHRFFGASYSAQFSHRLPNAAISANASRGLSSYPQLALAIPAGTTVNQFLSAAFATRIPDPVERAAAVEQFLARTGLPPTLAAPVNLYGATLTVQQSASVSLVLIGVRNSVTFSLFNSTSEAISGTGTVLPPAFQGGQNNTQTGASVAYSRSLSGNTNFGASANYSITRSNNTDGTLANARSRNGFVNASLSTRLGPKTNCTGGVSYTWYESPEIAGFGLNNNALNVFASISHTF